MSAVLERKITSAQSPTIFAKKFLGIDLFPEQQRWLETRSRVKVAACGRRWGKSYAEAIDLLWMACGIPESVQFLITPTYDQADTIFSYAVSMVKGSQLLAPHVAQVVRSPFPFIQMDNGATINARSAGEEGKNVRSKGADRVLFDEAAFIPAAARQAIDPLLANSPIAERVYISSPFGKNYFWELYTRGDPPNREYASFRFPSSSSPHVSVSYLAQQRLEMTALAYSVEYDAEFAENQNAVFPWTLIRSCNREDIEREPKTGRTYVIGWDPAQFTDRSGVAVLDVTSRPWQLVHCTDIAGRDYPVQEAEIKGLQDKYNGAFVLLDATSHAPVLQHLQAAGVRAEGFTFTNTSKRELIDGTVLAMEQGDLVFPLIPDLVDEMKWYRYEMTASGNVKLGAAENHHDDLVTALALAVFAISSRPRPVTAPPSSLSAPSRWR